MKQQNAQLIQTQGESSIMNHRYFDDLDEDFKQLLRPLLLIENYDNVDNEDTIVPPDKKEWSLQLFQQTIGPYQNVIDSARALVQLEVSDEIFYFETSNDRGFDRWCDPLRRYLQGPRADIHVFVGLFFGIEEERESRKEGKENDEEGGIEHFVTINNNISTRLREMPVLEVTYNILTRLSVEAAAPGKSMDDLFRFCVMYGLSNAAHNVLMDKYGNTGNLTVNSPLLVPKEEEERTFFGGFDSFLPALGFATVFGHKHVIKKLVQELGADLQQPIGYKQKDKDFQLAENDRIGARSLVWAILTKQPEMVKELVDCGVQFRWLNTNELSTIFNKLFHVNCDGDEYGPLWLPQSYDCEKYFSMSDIRRYRAKCCYKEKEKMIMSIINAGCPRNLFLPTIDTTITKIFDEEAKEKNMDEPERKKLRKVMDLQMTRREKKAREFIYGAACSFNYITKRDKQKSFEEFYDYCVNLWKDHQEMSQDVLLADFENADPRWRLELKKKKKGHIAFCPWWEAFGSEDDDEEEESDYESGSELEQDIGLQPAKDSDADEEGLSSSDSEYDTEE